MDHRCSGCLLSKYERLHPKSQSYSHRTCEAAEKLIIETDALPSTYIAKLGISSDLVQGIIERKTGVC